MSVKDTTTVEVRISWTETVAAIEDFLYSTLPPSVTDKQLVDLQVLVGNARARLLEGKGRG